MESESIKLVFSEATQSDDTIQCHLSPEISAVNMEIRWFKETKCVCFYKNRQLIQGIGYEGRVSLYKEKLKSGNVSLQLKESDVGDYLCQVISGNRTGEITVRKSSEPKTGTLWTEQPNEKWSEKDRTEMANSALSAVFHSLENIIAQTEKIRLQKDPQAIQATVRQTDSWVGEKQSQTEVKTTQQEDMNTKTCENMETSVCEPEEQTDKPLDNQQSVSHSLENREKTETKTKRLQKDLQGNAVRQTDREVEKKQSQTEEKTTQQEDMNTKTCENMETSAYEPEEQTDKPLDNQQSDPGQMSTQPNKNKDESQQSKKMKQSKKIFKPRTKEIKVFSISDGKTNECEKQFIDTLKTRIENLMEVSTEEESDIILNFCPIFSRAGTDIDAALNKFKDSTESKLIVLVVLHHTFDREKTVLDSSRIVNRTDLLTVDLLFYEDTGLLECQKNSEAYKKVVNWLIQEGPKIGIPINQLQKKPYALSVPSCLTLWNNSEPSGQNMQQMKSISSRSVKYYLSVTGDAKKHHMHFMNYLKKHAQPKQMSLMEGSTVKDSDVIFLFCPEITDYHRSEDKPVILISLYNTMVPGPLSTPRRTRAIIPMECIFDHKGLLDCKINTDEISAVSDILQQVMIKRTSQ